MEIFTIKNEYVFANIEGAIRELRFIGNELSLCPAGGFSNEFLFENSEGVEYKTSVNETFYLTLDEAKRYGTGSSVKKIADCDDLVIENVGCILFDGWCFKSWIWSEKQNEPVRYSVGDGWEVGNMHKIRILNGMVEYYTFDYKKIKPNSKRYFPTKTDCMKAHEPKVVLFNRKPAHKDVVEVTLTIPKEKIAELKKIGITIEK